MRRVLSIVMGVLLSMAAMGADKAAKDSTTAVPRYADGTRIYADTAIWQGMNIKVDLGTPIEEFIVSAKKIRTVEMAMNCRLKNRWYPTLELGYAQAKASADGGRYEGYGGFTRVGLDINALKKNAKGQNALLAGVRVGTAFQEYNLYNVTMQDPYWGILGNRDFPNQFRCDVWGEIVAGCQVHLWAGLHMGWYVRLKLLFTRSADVDNVMSYYIPGYGYRDRTNWGFNYYIGYKF